jgi:prepilin-type N-terminal cleavage/methylation domain-containing protein
MKKGFTLVELIIVLALMGIVSLTIIPKLEMTSFKESADVDSFISFSRFAQHKSMVTGNSWRIIINSSENKYAIDNDSLNTNDLPQIPGGDNPISVNTSISSDFNEIYFDYLGRPVNSSNIIINTEIKVQIGSQNVIIEPFSGGIYVQ